MKYKLFGLIATCLLYGLIAQNHCNLKMINSPKNYQTTNLGFSQAVESNGLLFTSGIVGWTEDYTLSGNQFEDQVAQCFLNIKQLLDETQSTFSQIAILRFYIVGLNSTKRNIINKHLKQIYKTAYKPATTLLGVQALAREELELEIEIIAKIY